VKVAYHATASLVGTVGPNVFLPKPKVESVLVSIVRRPGGPAVATDPDRLFALVRAGFGQRRKMLRRSLAALVTPDAFDAAGVAPTARAEELSVEDWSRLADANPNPTPNPDPNPRE
jgi:16S rRNA (adenine1518-N6/adenine1519-N6)-dimethyltransferase